MRLTKSVGRKMGEGEMEEKKTKKKRDRREFILRGKLNTTESASYKPTLLTTIQPFYHGHPDNF